MDVAPIRIGRFRAAALALVVLAVAGCSSPEEKAAEYVKNGMALLEEGETNKAGIEFRNALRLNEDLAEAWFGLSIVEESRQNWPNVNAALVRVLELEPRHLQAALGLGRIMLLAGEFEKALEYSKTASSIAPDTPATKALRAAILFRMDDHSGATTEAEQVLEADPGNVDALAILAAVRFAAGDIDAALGLLERGLEKNERNIGLQVFKLRILDRLKDYAEVEAVLRNLVELFPDEAAFRRELVRFLLLRERPDDAEAELRAIAAAEPDNTDAALDVVRLVNQVKGFDAARAELDERIAADSGNLRFHRFLAQLEIANGEGDSAIARLREVAGNEKFDEVDRNLVRVDIARYALTGGNRQEARELAAQVLQDDASNVGALQIQASLKIDEGNFESAISDLRTALAEDPQSANIQALLARAHALNGSLELADQRYREAMQNSDQAPRIALAYAEFLQKQGSTGRAEEIIAEAVEQSPQNADLLGRLAEYRLRRQDWIGAEEIARQIRNIEKESVVSDRIEAAVQAGQGRLDDSITILRGVHERSPGGIAPMTSLVRAYVRSGKSDEARTFLENILEINPDNAEAWVLMGGLAHQSGDAATAAENYSTAISANPKNPTGYLALSTLHIRDNDLEAAAKVLREGRIAIPDNFTIGVQLAGVEERRGDRETAIEILEELYVQQPLSDVVANNLASLLAEVRSDTESLDRAAKLAARLRKSPIPHFKDTVGWVHYKRGEYQPALELLSEAVEELPNIALVRYHLAMAHKAAGNRDEAIAEFEKAKSLTENEEFIHAAEIEAALAELMSETQTDSSGSGN